MLSSTGDESREHIRYGDAVLHVNRSVLKEKSSERSDKTSLRSSKVSSELRNDYLFDHAVDEISARPHSGSLAAE